MSDRIEGVAILDETCTPARLHFVCVRANGDRKPWLDSIPVRPAGSPIVPEQVTWEFKKNAAMLEMKPSVRMSYVTGYNPDKSPIMKEFFHNEGQWSVLFIPWKARADYVSDGSGVDFEGIQARMKTLNASIL